MPDVILELLVPFYDMVGSRGKWPYALTRAAVTLIPKGEGMLPLSQRPLSVMSIVYRIWAAVRVCSRPIWVHGCADVLAKVSVEFEDAILEGRHVVGAAVDFAKVFDNVPTAIALSVLKHLGMHPGILDPMIGMYASLKRHFKIKGYLGEMFRATNGRAVAERHGLCPLESDGREGVVRG